MAGLPRITQTLLVDGHVHFYGCFETQRFLDAAADNFARIADQIRASSEVLGCLVICETTGGDPLARLHAELARGKSDWSLVETEEQESRFAVRDQRPRMIVVAGRQLISRERLEVLALGTCQEVSAGEPLIDTAAEIRQAGAVPVVPWGFGKWWFQRREILVQCLRGAAVAGWEREMFVGDSGNRCRSLTGDRVFAIARSLGIRDLPGSDPLPLSKHQCRAGSAGFILPISGETQRPMSRIKRALANCGQPERFGKAATIVRFARDQLALRLGTVQR